ncbi:hypothetical protein F5B17DRAFT_451212 [Nemania serpens]|nr:hypothetical protein F5B17DRAFT_451212 [Nemania serpens]
METLTKPLVVIPLGRLFVNKSGRSIWTGYELFVSGSLEIWMVYGPSEWNTLSWLDSIDTGLFAQGEDPSGQVDKCKLARFCGSIRDLGTVTFEGVRKELEASTGESLYVGFYALEVSKSDAGDFVALDATSQDESNAAVGLRSENIMLGLDRPACVSQLLLLARENYKRCFVRFTPGESKSHGNYNMTQPHDTSLLKEAIDTKSWRIVDMILASKNVHAYANEGDFSDGNILLEAERAGRETLVKLILSRTRPNLVDESV